MNTYSKSALKTALKNGFIIYIFKFFFCKNKFFLIHKKPKILGFFIIIIFGGGADGFYHTNWLDDLLPHLQNCHNCKHHFEILCMTLFWKIALIWFASWVSFFKSRSNLLYIIIILLNFVSKSSILKLSWHISESFSFFKSCSMSLDKVSEADLAISEAANFVSKSSIFKLSWCKKCKIYLSAIV